MEEFWKDINHVPSSSSSSSASPPPPPPPPSSYKFHEFFSQPFRINLDSPSTTSDTNPSFVRTSSTSLFPPSSSSSHKRLFEPEGSLRSKRMIKNRESAARSRARKQAYTHELEQKLALLKKENAMLTKQLEELDEASAAQKPQLNSAAQKPQLNKLPYRSLTAPF